MEEGDELKEDRRWDGMWDGMWDERGLEGRRSGRKDGWNCIHNLGDYNSYLSIRNKTTT